MHMFYNMTPNDEGVIDAGERGERNKYHTDSYQLTPRREKRTNPINANTTYTRMNPLPIGILFCFVNVMENKRNKYTFTEWNHENTLTRVRIRTNNNRINVQDNTHNK